MIDKQILEHGSYLLVVGDMTMANECESKYYVAEMRRVPFLFKSLAAFRNITGSAT